jgi:CHAD domain-containing protein
VKAAPVRKLDPERSLGENAARIIKVRLDEMVAFAPRALDGKTKAQHDMRIAAKRLRYVLEVTGFCFGDPADTARLCARDLQDVLGDIHDCDVMLPRVRRHMEELQWTDRGLEMLEVHLKGRRRLLIERFAALWRRQEELGTWVRLERALEAGDARLRHQDAAASGR